VILPVGQRSLSGADLLFRGGCSTGGKFFEVGATRGAKYKFEINRQVSQRLATLRKRLR
jgi:hypothetical protein